MKHLAGAIVFSVLVFAILFRFEYKGPGGINRVDRWTGTVEYLKQGEWVKWEF